jgi:hypothetical protein
VTRRSLPRTEARAYALHEYAIPARFAILMVLSPALLALGFAVVGVATVAARQTPAGLTLDAARWVAETVWLLEVLR